MPTSRPDFLQALWSQIEPADLRWIYLTHPDRDHTGSLMEILDAAPAARLVTTFLGLGILSLEYQIGLDRIFLLNPGQSLDLGDRRLTAFRPPVYDSPATTGCYDQRTGTCFTSDCFGSPVAFRGPGGRRRHRGPTRRRPARRTAALGDRRQPLGDIRRPGRVSGLAPTAAQLDPAVVLCTHLPPAHAAAAQLLDTLETAPDADPFVGPDQAALESVLAPV